MTLPTLPEGRPALGGDAAGPRPRARQAVRRDPRAGRGRPRCPRRQRPRPSGAQRCRKVHTHQGARPGVHQADAGQITVDGHPLGSHAASAGMFLGPPGPRSRGVDDGRREHRSEHRVSPPRRPDLLEADPGALRRRPENRRRTSRPRRADRPALPAERSLVAISRGLAAHAKLIVLDEPTARLPPRTAPGSSACSTPCATRGTAFSTSATGWTTCTRSPTPSPCCATATSSATARWRAGPPPVWCTTSSARNWPATGPPRCPADGPAVLTLDGVRTTSTDLSAWTSGPGKSWAWSDSRAPGTWTWAEPSPAPGPSSPGVFCSAVSRSPAHGRRRRPPRGGLRERRQTAGGLRRGTDGAREPPGQPRRGRPVGAGWDRARRERAEAAELIERLSVPPKASPPLSGGNQQKVVIGRWLRVGLRLLILEEADHDVDIGARPRSTACSTGWPPASRSC